MLDFPSGATYAALSAAPGEGALSDILASAAQAFEGKRLDEAARLCLSALDRVPDQPVALALLGTIAAQRDEVEHGIRLLERACTLNGTVANWHANLAVLCRVANRLEEGLAASQRAVQIAPDHLRYRLNLALLQKELGRREEAVGTLLGVLAQAPESAEARLSLAELLLEYGEFRPGWREYEARTRTAHGRQSEEHWPKMAAPEWNGMRLPGGRILLIGDQGFGDVLQFARYIPMVAERCAEVALACDPNLAPLFTRTPGLAHCLCIWAQAPPHAAYCRLSSLPGVFGTELGNIPAEVPYIRGDPARVAAWRERLEARLGPARPRVGLAWAGRPTHPNDRRRSLRLAQLAPITAVLGAAFVSLQKPVPPADAETLAGRPHLLDLSSELTDFAETAAVVANVDLVITIDSAVAHLAGTMGKPVWVLLPRPADWRWLPQRSDSPWYPTMRLFRQPAPGAWQAPISDIARELREWE